MSDKNMLSDGKTPDKKSPSTRSLRALDALNVFLTDIQGGVGPFLVVFLMASLH